MPEAVVGAGKSVSAALSEATTVFTAAGCATSRLDAELLLSFVLGVARERLVARREAREPVAYIVGRKAFRRISLSVDRRVLIPRPETELLVEVALSVGRGARVADVGTGSGPVALSLKEERPDVSVVGVDVSADALEVARANALTLGLDVEFVRADLLDGVPGPFDAVLANLPYVADESALPPEIELYEPPLALFGGPDGMDLTRRLAMLDDVPLVALEVGLGEAVASLVARAGFSSVDILRDLAGHERVVVGRR